MDTAAPNRRPALPERYRVLGELGAGGAARVYVALDHQTNTKVAIKILRPELAGSISAQRFRREIQLLGALTHPNILPLLASDEAAEVAYYVMPFAADESLRQRLDGHAPLPLDGTLGVARDVAAALDYAHARQIVHRDIKPENILFRDGRAVVADFGVARALDRSATDATLSSSGISLGTPRYMSPEQGIDGRSVDHRSDIYALGCVTYEMLTGEPPFDGPTGMAVIAKHASQPPPSLLMVRPDLPGDVERAIARALAKVPAERYDSAGDFVRDLALGARDAPRQSP